MPAPAYMPMFIKDYLADTYHLEAVEHGAYLLLIFHYWCHGSLPTDNVTLAKISRVTPHQWRKILPRIQAFFYDGWKHKRIEAEFAKYVHIKEVRTIASEKGVAAKRAKRATKPQPNGSRLVNQGSTQAEAEAKAQDKKKIPPLVPVPLLNQDSKSEGDSSAQGPISQKAKPAVRGERWPPDAVVPDEWIVDGLKLGLTVEAVRFETGAFVDWAIGAGSNGVKLDWRATWRNWLRRIIRERRGGAGQRGDRAGSGKPSVFEALADDLAEFERRKRKL